MAKTLAAMGLVVLLAGCSTQDSSNREAVRSYVREVTGDDLKQGSGLRVTANDVTTDGRIAKVRGRVQNNLDEPVRGIRYVVTLYQNGDPPRVLDRWQHEVDTTLDPGDGSGVSLDIESMYFGSSGSVRFIIDAQPVKLGAKEMPPPKGWQ